MKRAAIISWIDGLTAQATDARVSTASDSSSGVRRPRASETGPPTSWPSAIPTKNVVSVSCTWVAPASRSWPTRGKAGTYMSVASGAIEVTRMIVASRPRLILVADADGGVPAPAPVRSRSTVWTVMNSLSGVWIRCSIHETRRAKREEVSVRGCTGRAPQSLATRDERQGVRANRCTAWVTCSSVTGKPGMRVSRTRGTARSISPLRGSAMRRAKSLSPIRTRAATAHRRGVRTTGLRWSPRQVVWRCRRRRGVPRP